MVSFKLHEEEYGVEVLTVREIIRLPEITKMPNTPYYVEGIINLRGRVIPIISMRKRFDLQEGERTNQSRIIVMDVGGDLTGFIVDGVSEVIRIPASEVQPPPAMVSGSIEQSYLTGVFNHAGQLLIIMDVERMFNEAERDALAEWS